MALEYFEKIIKSTERKNSVSPIIVYNAGLAAKNAGEHKKAALYFRRSIDMQYGGSDAYYLLKNEYIALKDSISALKTLQEGYENYPDTALILFELVNYYLSIGNIDQGLIFLTMAFEKEPNNPSISFARGTLYEKAGFPEKALNEYLNSLKIDPKFFNSHFNIGALYFNRAVEYLDIANQQSAKQEFFKWKFRADSLLEKSSIYFENCYRLKASDQATRQTLQTIYFRLQSEKYEKLNANRLVSLIGTELQFPDKANFIDEKDYLVSGGYGNLTELFQQCGKAVFLIVTEDNYNYAQGSGFFISKDGTAVSNYHVVNSHNKNSARIYSHDEKVYRISSIIQENSELDFVKFKIVNLQKNQFHFLNLSQKEPSVGEQVFTIGNPKGFLRTLSNGIVSGYRENNKYIQTNVDITHGSSGGPLLNMQGEVIGITTMGIEEGNLNFALNVVNRNME